jgi:hypothetical protein
VSPRTCRDVRADISAYLDDDLDPVLTGEVRAHLAACAACRSELDQLRLTVGALRRLPELPPPAAILAGVRTRLRPEPWYRRLPDGRRWPPGVPVGALATLLVVIGISLFQTRHPGIERLAEQAPAGPVAPIAEGLRPAAGAGAQDRRSATLPPRPTAKEKPGISGSTAPQAPPGRDVPLSGNIATGEVRHREDLIAAPSRPGVTAPAAKPNVEEVKDFGGPQDRGYGTPRRDAAFVGALEEPPRAASGADAKVQAVGPPSASSRAAAPGTIGPSRLRIVCLLPPDGGTPGDLEQLLRREGAGAISVAELDLRAVREAFAPHRARLGSRPGPVRGWTMQASIPPGGLSRLIDALTHRANLRLLAKPAAVTTADEFPGEQILQVTVLQ